MYVFIINIVYKFTCHKKEKRAYLLTVLLSEYRVMRPYTIKNGDDLGSVGELSGFEAVSR
jgi:hypothetical protein